MIIEQNNAALRNLSALVDFSKLINSNLELDFTLNNLLLTCFGKFFATRGLIALFNENAGLEIKASKGINDQVLQNFKEKVKTDNSSETLDAFLKENHFVVMKEIITSDNIRGYIFLGEKFNKQDYTEDDLDFLSTILNVAATAIENSIMVEKLQKVNRDLDGKVNQLSSLFDLSKEFSGILEEKMVGKLVVFSLIGQLMVSKFAILKFNSNSAEFIDCKFDRQKLEELCESYELKTISKPLNKDEIKDYSAELNDLGISLVIPMQIKGVTKGMILLGSRINGQEYTNSDIEFVSSVGSLAIISIENARLFQEALEKEKLEKDLELARKIQQNLLPGTYPQLESFDIAAINLPARQVGGDYYDIVKLDDKRTLFAIGDVSGKGVQASLIMANTQAFLKSICKQSLSLDEATNLMNDLISENTSGGGFVTFFWGILNDETNELTYVNAGHNPPLLIRDGKIEFLKKGGMILGVMETIVPYMKETVKLQPGDALVTFTDGITEAMNVAEEEFSDERFEKFALKIAKNTAREILDQIIETVSDFAKGAEQSDDITCLVVKVK